METLPLVVFSIIGLIVIFNAILWFKLRRFEKIIQGNDESNNGQIVQHKTKEDLKKLDKDVQELYEINSRITKISKRGICKIGVTKFNAFSEKSGNQSFAIALLDWSNNGVVFSNLQTSQGARLFVRPIHQGEAANGAELLVEEKKALERAKQVVF